MKLDREYKINPYASCLPIVFQIPIFIALFFVLKDAEDNIFKGLSDSALDWLGLVDITENVKAGWGPLLLVVYVISQLTSTWLMSTSMQSTAQRVLIMALPIFFIPFILNFPSGLMIYWLTTNLWTTGQGLVTRRLMPRQVAPPPKRSSRTPPKAAAEQSARAPSSAASVESTDDGPTRTGPPRRVKRKKGGRPRR
jgi:YidC/Oxa1 family membrane protein insertase